MLPTFHIKIYEILWLETTSELLHFRTARGDNKGTALSFVSLKEMKLLEVVEKELSGSSEGGETLFKPYQFRMEEIEGFRYRAKVSS